MKRNEQQEVFTRNLNRLLETNKLTQTELAEKTGIGKTTINNWCNGLSTPKMWTIQKLADFFGVSKSALIDDIKEDEDYYLNAETRRLAKEAFENPDVRMLFDATRRISPEDMKAVIEIARRLGK